MLPSPQIHHRTSKRRRTFQAYIVANTGPGTGNVEGDKTLPSCPCSGCVRVCVGAVTQVLLTDTEKDTQTA